MDLTRFSSLNFLGRLLLSAIFINAIPGKITNFAAQAEYITNRGFPEPVSMIMMVGAIVLTYSKKGGIKKQSYLKQITREREDSIEVVDVEFDKGVKIND